MDIVIIVLGILYLCGVKVGTALAVCSIIEGVLVFILNLCQRIEKSKKAEDEWFDSLFKTKNNNENKN